MNSDKMPASARPGRVDEYQEAILELDFPIRSPRPCIEGPESMPVNSTGKWKWERTTATQRNLLDAAQTVFLEKGYLDGNVVDIVKQADSSMGSLYHHFHGKAELFNALWAEHSSAHFDQVRIAVSDARAAGVTDPLDLFCVGARAFLEGSWERRRVAQTFIDADGPPGFEKMRREARVEWIRQNSALLGLTDSRTVRVRVGVLTDIIVEAGREVATCKTKRQANEIADTAETMIRKLQAPD